MVFFELTVPNSYCGRVIGKGGKKINLITVSPYLHIEEVSVLSSYTDVSLMLKRFSNALLGRFWCTDHH